MDDKKEQQHLDGLLAITNNLISLLHASHEYRRQAILRGAKEDELRDLQAREIILYESLRDLSNGLVSESLASRHILNGDAIRFNASYSETISHVDKGLTGAKEWRENLGDALYDSMESALAKIEMAQHRQGAKSSLAFLDRVIARRDRIIEKMRDIRNHISLALEAKITKVESTFKQFADLGSSLLDASKNSVHDFFEKGRANILTGGVIASESLEIIGLSLWHATLGAARNAVTAAIRITTDTTRRASAHHERVSDERTLQVAMEVAAGDDSSLWMLEHLVTPDRKMANGESLADIVVNLAGSVEKLSNPHLMLELGQLLIKKGSTNEQLSAAIEAMNQKIAAIDEELSQRPAAPAPVGRCDVAPPPPIQSHIRRVRSGM